MKKRITLLLSRAHGRGQAMQRDGRAASVSRAPTGDSIQRVASLR